MEATTTKCNLCQKPATQKCGGCHVIFYCTRDHQKSDWKLHKRSCQPFSICEDSVLGRHLVATRPIKEGEVILKEPALIWGPSQITVPVCLGCGKGLNDHDHKPCQKCGWPMCSEICQNSPSHLPECSYTASRGEKVSINTFNVQHPTYQCLMVLRCLYHKQFLPELWNKLDKLQSHCEERKRTPRYQNDKIAVVKFLQKFMKLDQFSDDEIHRVCGIVMVNAHEVPLSEPPHIAIYERTSMFEHSCRANCCKSFTSSGGILISAGKSIASGEHLSICYTDPLWSTPSRRNHLYESKFFWCQCERCCDVSELDTYFSCIQCTKQNCKGIMKPESFLDGNDDTPWTCSLCSNAISAAESFNILDDVGIQLHEMKRGSSNACKVFLNRWEKALTPCNHYLTDVRIAMSQIIGQEYSQGLMVVSDDDLLLKARLCRQLEELVSKLAPSERRVRGMLLFELHASISELGRREAGITGPQALHTSLIESKAILQKAVEFLKYEPEVLPEGKICFQAKINLEDVDMILRTVHQQAGDTIM